MIDYVIPEYPPIRYRVDVSNHKGTNWIGHDVPSFAAARELIDLQPKLEGYRYRIVSITESIEWETP